MAGTAIPFTVVAAGCGVLGSPAATHLGPDPLTDPLPGAGWIDRAPGGEGEAADLCQAEAGRFSAYWSNAVGGCVR